MVGPVVVHWLVPLITVKFPDASIFNFVLSYFNDTVFDVFKKGFENVKLFCFVVNNVVDVEFRLFILNNYNLINCLNYYLFHLYLNNYNLINYLNLLKLKYLLKSLSYLIMMLKLNLYY